MKQLHAPRHELVKTEISLSISTATSTKVSLPIKQKSMPINESVIQLESKQFSPPDKSILTLQESTNNFIRKFSDTFSQKSEINFEKSLVNKAMSLNENVSLSMMANREIKNSETLKFQEKTVLKG